MNAQLQLPPLVILPVVTGWHVASVKLKGRNLRGYALTGETSLLGFIETTKPHPRIETLLGMYSAPPFFFTARELMRDLLNAEDYRSDIYDAIVRVYYPEDLT